MKQSAKLLSIGLAACCGIAYASSHREAPFIASQPTVDATDFYMFNSYEAGRSDYVTLIANYDPLQDAYGGPNYFALNPNAEYDINIDNNGDAQPDMIFRFRFHVTYGDISVPSGDDGSTAIPLINAGQISAADTSALNRTTTYTISLLDHGSMVGHWNPVSKAGSGPMRTTFTMPVDNIGEKSIPDYANYANQYIYEISVPGCSQPGRVFVGQRKDGFVVDLGEIFDLVNLNPAGSRDSTRNTLHDKNVTSLALEVPKACLIGDDGDPVIGAWTTASIPQIQLINGDPKKMGGVIFGSDRYTQVSRLGAPLVNEVVIGLKDKDMFNASQPRNDAQFLHYVTNPSLPVLLNALFGNAAQVPHTPRMDLVTAFLTGVPGLNQPYSVIPSEQLRLNTSIPATPPNMQNDLGVLGGDLAGFPNGRRPYDDVVDIALRVMEGALCGKIGKCGDEVADPNSATPYTDGAEASGATAATANPTGDEYADDTYLDQFPYLHTPIPGSPNGSNGTPAN